MFTNARTNDLDAVALACMPGRLAHEAPEEVCRRLARSHYENFVVGSVLLPRKLRAHVYNVYAYCRMCDDLADETGDPELSLLLLRWWREELRECYDGHPRHPVFQALADTIREFDLPIEPFDDLISAFEQDQRVTRYESFGCVLDYCSRSANPVGRIFLYLLGYSDQERRTLADYTCTALQLTNFWQDITADYERGRIYLPREDMERFGYSEGELRNHILNNAFRRLLRFEIERTREFFERGAALQRMIRGVGAADVRLFSDGGLAVLESIQRRNYNVFDRRITVPKLTKAALMVRWCAGSLLGGARNEG